MARLQQAQLSFSTLQEDHGDLRLKYEDLVKPARSAAGRFLAEARVAKMQGQIRLGYRESRNEDFQPVSRGELDARLSRLKTEHQEGLYVRVIIPRESGLSYNEAWSFTSEIHGKYDYYFQDVNRRSDD